MGERFRNLDKNFVCSFFNCKASFSKSWKLEAHLCKHTGLRPFACVSCDKSFCTRYQLTRHHLTHSGEKPYRCSVEGCPQTFASNGSMKNHVAHVHLQKDNQYVCEIDGCGKEFRKRTHLKTHQYEHTNIFPFECNFQGCNQRFIGIKPLQKHGKVHDGYPCAESGCSFKGNTWSEYQKHRKQHRPVLHCDSCKKVFRETCFLQIHRQRVHLGEQRVFCCIEQGCQKSYTTEFNLKSHVLSVHEGETPFKCPHSGCNKAFAMKESLRRHGVVHDPEKKKMKKNGAPKVNKAANSAAVPDASKIAASLQSLTLAKPKPTDEAKAKPTDKAKAKHAGKPKPRPKC
ncbi:general transcription factor IIIA, b [Alosa sapidissima]|uniref:general transcription factor IIIA, b n=1 Tax=Alosa sapidissima TaxID=34773 RepID=UPI001C08903D|nr:general transcription factor IIIA, b [Alosa sapidissima]